MEPFKNVVGQKRVKRRLTSQLASGEISHAYLFVGPNGSGKNFLAREFSKNILGIEPNDSLGNHPDFIFVDGSAGIKIDQVREIIERVNLSPNLSSFKVLYLSRAENMGQEAAYAMLKTFEEPPADTVIIISATSAEVLPQTILSRAQLIRLQPLAKEEIEKILSKDFKKSEIDEVLELVRDNLGKAKEMLENPDTLSATKLMLNEINIITEGKSLIEKFNILEKYDKEKRIRDLWELFSAVVFDSLGSELKGRKSLAEFEISKKANLKIAQKIVQINANLTYNVNLRLALEEIILEYFSPIGAE